MNEMVMPSSVFVRTSRRPSHGIRRSDARWRRLMRLRVAIASRSLAAQR
jgi:hypothetical protein